MKPNIPQEIERHRVTTGPLASDSSFGRNGAFLIHQIRSYLLCIVSDQAGWEHVSVTVRKRNGTTLNRCPTWKEMCHVKSLFWEPDEVVVQYHPAQAEYVNLHPFCLHLWKPVQEILPVPPSWMVGPIRRAS